MSRLFGHLLLAAPAALGAALAVSAAAPAAELTPDMAAAPTTPAVSVDALDQPLQLAQITSVNQLTDVQPTDWAFQALQSLVEQYGCIQGYPDRTYRGAASLTRFEFAAGLNACLDVIAQLVATGINPDELATIRRLQEEFQAELNTLRGRVDALEADVAELEANQFSTTTVLRGQVDAHLAIPFDTFPGSPAPGALVAETSPTFFSRARLNFDTSFTGRDRLRTRLQASSGNPILTGIGALNNASGVGLGTLNVGIDDLWYSFPLGNRLDVTLGANSLSVDDILRNITPFGNAVSDPAVPPYLDAGKGSGAGVGLRFAFTDSLLLDAIYTVNTAGAANPAVGIFQGTTGTGASQSYGAQLNFVPRGGFLSLAASYIRSDGGLLFAGSTGKALDTFGGQANLRFGNINIGGSAGFLSYDGGDDFTWTGGVTFNDFLARGTQLGVLTGQTAQFVGRASNPFFVEGYLNVPFNQFLTITPAVIYADYNTGTADESVVYGVVRTTFRF